MSSDILEAAKTAREDCERAQAALQVAHEALVSELNYASTEPSAFSVVRNTREHFMRHSCAAWTWANVVTASLRQFFSLATLMPPHPGETLDAYRVRIDEWIADKWRADNRARRSGT